MPIARTIYSMPPDHGTAIVAHILGDEMLRGLWRAEVRMMRERIDGMRGALVDCLAGRGARDYGFLRDQRGMLGISPDAVERLRSEYHVHVTGSGRANVAGITPADVERVARGIAAVS